MAPRYSRSAGSPPPVLTARLARHDDFVTAAELLGLSANAAINQAAEAWLATPAVRQAVAEHGPSYRDAIASTIERLSGGPT